MFLLALVAAAQVVQQHRIDPDVLVALIGAPAAFLTAVGTVWLAVRKGKGSTSSISPTMNGRMNGHRFVTHTELREIIADVKAEMRAMESRQSTQLELIVSLLKDR